MSNKADLEVLFFDTAEELRSTLNYAESMKSNGETIRTYGRAVTLARMLVAIEDAIELMGGNVHEDNGDTSDIAQRVAAFAKRATNKPRNASIGTNDRTSNRV